MLARFCVLIAVVLLSQLGSPALPKTHFPSAPS